MKRSEALAWALLLLTGVVALSIPARPIQPKEPERDLCEHVAHELNLWYLEGSITADEAHSIIQRCFKELS